MKEHAFEELPWIARELRPLIDLDPDLVEEIYRAAFTHQEASQAATSMGSSKILALTSNRRQDFQGALYELAVVYPEFLQKATIHATRALISALEAYVAVERASATDNPQEERFDFEGREAMIRTDYSAIWDSGSHPTHDALTLLSAFDTYLRALSGDPGKAQTRRQILNVLISWNRLAVVWRHLLIAGSAFPHTLGLEIRCLAWAKPILTSFDTSTTAGDFIRAIFGALPPADRERIERAILSIPGSLDDKRRKNADVVRDRLLGCLPPESIVTDDVKGLLVEVFRRGGPLPTSRFSS